MKIKKYSSCFFFTYKTDAHDGHISYPATTSVIFEVIENNWNERNTKRRYDCGVCPFSFDVCGARKKIFIDVVERVFTRAFKCGVRKAT